METKISPNRIKFLNRILAFSILVLCVIYIYQRLQKMNHTGTSFAELKHFIVSTKGILSLFAVLVLTFLNWFIEALKWKYLLSDFLVIKKGKALSSILMGLSVTMVIPYRVGSFIGRVWKFKPAVRGRAVVASIFGGLAQLFVTVILGLIALSSGTYELNGIPQVYITFISFILLVVISITYFFPMAVISLFQKIPILSKLSESFRILGEYSMVKKIKVVLYSLLRYSIFIFQFYIILNMFSPELSMMKLVFPLSLVFLILSIAPTIFFGLGVREFSAILLLSPIIASEGIIVLSSLILWLCNMIIPAIIGASLFVHQKTING